jgi:hypothetical protein
MYRTNFKSDTSSIQGIKSIDPSRSSEQGNKSTDPSSIQEHQSISSIPDIDFRYKNQHRLQSMESFQGASMIAMKSIDSFPDSIESTNQKSTFSMKSIESNLYSTRYRSISNPVRKSMNQPILIREQIETDFL